MAFDILKISLISWTKIGMSNDKKDIKIIENISGEKLNESSIKAAVEDISKKNMGKYL